MKIKNKHRFIAGIISLILSIVCLIIYGISTQQKYLVASILTIVMTFSHFYNAFLKKDIFEELQVSVDERDHFITMKASHQLVQIMNYTLCAFTILFGIAYSFWKDEYLLVIAITLCCILIVMFVINLCLQLYLEKAE